MANTKAGMNGNRTGFTDTHNGTLVTDIDYCYDWADRLTGSVAAIPGGNPVLGGNLSTTAPLPSLVYDSHGNTTKLADQTLSYDVADRHVGTTLTDGTAITYQRDATGRIVSRTVDTPTEAPATIKYTGGGGMSMVLDSGGTVIQRTMGLPGGVQYAVNSDTTQVWSYPSLHGDVILTADSAGARTGRFAYDPFGQPIDRVTGAIGTAVADDAVPDNLPGDADHAYVGQHQKLYEHQGSVATVEMGVRQCPRWGGSCRWIRSRVGLLTRTTTPARMWGDCSERACPMPKSGLSRSEGSARTELLRASVAAATDQHAFSPWVLLLPGSSPPQVGWGQRSWD